MKYGERCHKLAANAGRALLLVALFAYPLLAGKNFRWQNMTLHCLVSLAVLLWYAAHASGGGRPVLVRHKLLDGALVALLGIVIIAASVSAYKYASLLFIVWLVDCLLAYWMAREAFAEGKWRWAVPVALVAAGVVCSVLGLREYARTVIFAGEANWRIFGPLYNPNILASYLIGPLLVALALIAALVSGGGARGENEAERRPRLGLIGLGFAVLLLGPAILLTGSRAGLAAAAAGLVVFALARGGKGQRRKRTMWVVGGVLVALVVAVVAAPPLRDRARRAFSMENHSTAFRCYTWLGTLDMMRDKPLLGVGPGTFEYSYPGYARAGYTRMSHQSYLQLAAEAGVFALLAALVVGIAGVRLCLWIARRQGSGAGALAAAAAGWLVGLALHNLFDYSMYVPAVAVSAFAVLGAAVAPVEMPSVERDSGSRRRWMGPAVALLLVLCLGLNLLTVEAYTALAESLLKQGRHYQAQESAVGAIKPLGCYSAESWEAVAKVYEAQIRGRDSVFLDKAIAARLRAVQLAPTVATSDMALARLYELNGVEEQALEYGRKAVAVYPTNPRGLASLGQVQEQAGLGRAAKATYKRLLALRETPVGKYPAVPELPDPSYVWAWAYLAADAYAEGDAETGTEMVYQSLVLINGRLQAQRLMFELEAQTTGRRAAELGEIEAMAERISELVWERPDRVNELLLAETRRRLGQWAKQEVMLLELMRRAEGGEEVKDAQVVGAAYLELGELYAGQNRDAEAKAAYAEGLRILRGLGGEAGQMQQGRRGRKALDEERVRELMERAEAAGN